MVRKRGVNFGRVQSYALLGVSPLAGKVDWSTML